MARQVFLGRLEDVAGGAERVVAGGALADVLAALEPDLAAALGGDRIRLAVNGALVADRAAYADFALAMLRQGVRILPRGTWFLSSAHEPEHIEQTLAAVEAALTER